MAPVRIAVVNDYEIVVVGVAALLKPFPTGSRSWSSTANAKVVSDVDVVLYDTFGQVQGDGIDLEDLVRGSDARWSSSAGTCNRGWSTRRSRVERAGTCPRRSAPRTW